MNVHDYLIEQDGKDWAELLSSWSEALHHRSRFGL
jgi:hypothetical protein